LEAAFSLRFVLMLYIYIYTYICYTYNEDTSRVESGWTPSVQEGSNTSAVALRVVGGDEKGTQCLEVKLGHTVPGGYKYGNLVLQDGEVSNMKQDNMVLSLVGPGSGNDCADEAQQTIVSDRPVLCQRQRPT
jgi:hypothetical protein